MNHTIDATNKSLGRLATEIASLLMGKNLPTYTRNEVSTNTVTVTNASKLSITEKRMLEKTYSRYSGYPGGLTKSTMAHVVAKKGYKEIVEMAVKGMLPDNKLKKDMMKHLTVNE